MPDQKPFVREASKVEQKPEITETQEIERVVSARREKPVETKKQVKEAPLASAHPVAPVPPKQTDQIASQIDRILEDGLSDFYKTLPDSIKPKFKKQGEEISKIVTVMVRQAKVKVRTIVDLIRKWLRMIPGVNQYFLDQEAKIKTDQIVMLARYEEERKHTGGK